MTHVAANTLNGHLALAETVYSLHDPTGRTITSIFVTHPGTWEAQRVFWRHYLRIGWTVIEWHHGFPAHSHGVE